jgi:hypothetical protein
MLFQAYIGGRPAEFVHSSKGKASEDPLGEREETSKSAHPRKAAHCDYEDDSDADDSTNRGISRSLARLLGWLVSRVFERT